MEAALQPVEILDPEDENAGGADLSESEHEARVRRCVELDEQIRQTVGVARPLLWTLTAQLYEFHEANGWSALGFGTQEEWLAQPEIGISRTEFFRMLRRWKQLHIRRQIPVETLAELEPSKLDVVMATIRKNKAPLEDVLADVKVLSQNDLREKYIPDALLDDDDDPPADPPGGADGAGTDDGPVNAATVGESEEDKARRAAEESLMQSAGHVDSWIELGGDRRKAQRHWSRLLEELPFFRAMKELEKTLEGVDGASPRQELGPAWEMIVHSLNLVFPEGQNDG